MTAAGASPPPDAHDAWHRDLARILEHAAHYLPAQAPLEVFVHHNTLHAYQHLHFYEAVEASRRRSGAAGFLDERAYRAAYASGRISDADLDEVLTGQLPEDFPTLPRGIPGARALAKLVLVHGVRPTTAAGLRWAIAEREALTRFAPTVSVISRERILSETSAWLSPQEVRRRGIPGARALLVGASTGTPFQLAEALGPDPSEETIRRLIDRDREGCTVASLWQACRGPDEDPSPPSTPRRRELLPRDAVLAVGADDPNDLVHPTLITLAGAFLDRGQSHWSMPDREHGFFVAVRRVLGAGHAVRPAWLSTLGRRLRAWEARGASAEDAVEELLAELGVGADERADFVERALHQLPGWAGMFHRLEAAPGPSGRSPARVRLADFLAVRLCLDVMALLDVGRRLGHRGGLHDLRAWCAALPPVAPPEPDGDHGTAWPLFLLAQHAGIAAPDLYRVGPDGVASLRRVLRLLDGPRRQRIWHEAYERHYREELLSTLDAGRSVAPPAPAARFQVVFCIDDRSESIRRHFEEQSPAHVTFGAAGFFNVAIAYQGIDDPSTFPLCPVVVTPRHRIVEEPLSDQQALAEIRRARRRRFGVALGRFQRASGSLVLGPLLAALAGFLAALPLLANVFAPGLAGRLRRRVGEMLLPEPRTRLAMPPAGNDRAESEALASGFALDEKVDRVATLLHGLGLTGEFAPVVAVIGHDSGSVNNPHFAAYSCGACGGRSGGPNARLIARMANRPEVRERLRARGIAVPDATVFLGGVYDTCADRIRFFDVDALPGEVIPEVEDLRAALDAACERNAHERCRKLMSAPRDATPEAARRHVEVRAYDLSQARPELGHATNAGCVVGRRSLTRGLFLDRRVFLVSYDPEQDPDGAVLERALLAAGPVCAGINLEYFFSTTDNERHGAGTKLPHNVTGLFGVMNGASSDLRTGLPKQMIEIHEPVRLQLVVEATRERLQEILARQPSLRELVENEWVRLCAVEPGGPTWVFERERGFVLRPVASGALQTVRTSADWYRGHDGFLPPARVLAGAAS